MILVDSDCIIDFLRGDEDAIKVVAGNLDEVVSSELNSFEVFFGIFDKENIPKNELAYAERFFENIKIFGLDSQCGKLSANILSDLRRRGIEINQNDCLIASVMIKNGISKIITKNKKHFSKIEGIEILNY
ncbi:MAG: type II toxin-antitoxin system VapC family toxin [Nanoarchaeota archaeon]|jgi:predicted nucleic acid-binding protein|nr:type II toxin-antitoxin system VapC family toxin [Nanoarchaeota archaeon]